jgi:hypothetical protein
VRFTLDVPPGRLLPLLQLVLRQAACWMFATQSVQRVLEIGSYQTTIETHISHILDKLNVRRRTDIAWKPFGTSRQCRLTARTVAPRVE